MHGTLPRPIRPFDGWALNIAAALDCESGGSLGLVAEICRTPQLKRQAVFAALSEADSGGVERLLSRLPNSSSSLSTALRKHTAREISAAVFGRRAPTGYLRALARVGLRPLRSPNLYRRLFELYADESESPKTRALRFCGNRLTWGMIEAVDVLDQVLLDPQIVGSMQTGLEAAEANKVVRNLRAVCSSLTDRQITASFREHGIARARMGRGVLRCLEYADPFPPPLFPPAGFEPVDTVRKMNVLGQKMNVCLSTKIGEVLLGLSYFYSARVEDVQGRSVLILIEMQASSHDTWTVEGVHGPGNRPVPKRIAEPLVASMEQVGAIRRINRANRNKSLVDALGVSRWDLDLPDLEGLQDALETL